MKLTSSQRRSIFHRWLAGNQVLAADGVPETMEQIGESYGVTKQAVAAIVRDLGGPGNRRRPGRKIRPCSEPGCEAPIWGRGRCRRHYERWRYRTNPEHRRRVLAKTAACAKRRRAAA